MLALHIENKTVSLRKTSRPKRPQGFALIRLRLAGICNTDIELLRGYYGFRGIPGHEFVGDVVDADAPEWIGKRVVGEINLACGKCDWCRRGLGRHCSHRTVLGIVRHPGAFRELLTLPVENLREVPKNVPDEQAVFTEPVAAACEILDQVKLPRNAPVAVLGDGKLGLLIAQVLAAHGAEVHLFGRHTHKLAIAEKAGVRTRMVDSPPKTRFPMTVDATGSASGLATAIQWTEPRGTVVMKSTVHDKVELDMAPVIVNEITLVGSRCGRFEPALQLLKRRKLHLDEMIEAEYPLDQGVQAFEHAQRRGALKILLRPQASK